MTSTCGASEILHKKHIDKNNHEEAHGIRHPHQHQFELHHGHWVDTSVSNDDAVSGSRAYLMVRGVPGGHQCGVQGRIRGQ